VALEKMNSGAAGTFQHQQEKNCRLAAPHTSQATSGTEPSISISVCDADHEVFAKFLPEGDKSHV
jgi:hypothetical protein